MFGIGSGEIDMILVVAMVVVGPERMVQFAQDAGRILAKFRQQTDGLTQEFREALALDMGEEEGDASKTGTTTTSPAQPKASSSGTATAGARPTPSPATATTVGNAPSVPSARPGNSTAPRASSAYWSPFVDSEVEITPPLSTGDVDGPDDAYATPVVIRVGELVPENDEEAEAIPIEPVLVVSDEAAVTDSPRSEGE